MIQPCWSLVAAIAISNTHVHSTINLKRSGWDLELVRAEPTVRVTLAGEIVG
jgi:hypothetical protein